MDVLTGTALMVLGHMGRLVVAMREDVLHGTAAARAVLVTVVLRGSSRRASPCVVGWSGWAGPGRLGSCDGVVGLATGRRLRRLGARGDCRGHGFGDDSTVATGG